MMATNRVCGTGKTYIVVGTGAAGQGVVSALVKLDKQCSIVWISDEKEKPYDKCRLDKYLAGVKNRGDITEFSEADFPPTRVFWKLASRVEQIDRHSKYVILSTGEKLFYDKLFLGLGRTPQLPVLEGLANTSGVFNYYRMSDIDAIKQYVTQHAVKSVVIVGVGLSGLECASALRKISDMSIALISRGAKILGSKIDAIGSSVIENRLRECGVEFYPRSQIVKVISQNGFLQRVELNSGEIIDADLVIFTTGGIVNSELVRRAGLVVWSDHENTLKVNEYMQTSDPSIFAAGDMVKVEERISKLFVHNSKWQDAIEQGELAAHNMLNTSHQKKYAGVAPIHISSFFNYEIAYYGDFGVEQKKAGSTLCNIQLDKGYCAVVLDDVKRIKAYFFVVHKKSAAGKRFRTIYMALKSNLESQVAIDVEAFKRLIV